RTTHGRRSRRAGSPRSCGAASGSRTPADESPGGPERRGWDSNPRAHAGLPVFNTGPFDRSGTPPRAAMVRVLRARLEAAEAARRAELPEGLRDGDRPALVLEVLHQRDHRPRGDGGSVQRRDVLELPVAPRADVE